ncbi:FMN-binding glutamate synthase family protein [Lederbergia wuyishanensis]|uniref:Glutamate synthase domain-containing protein 2 n=1 Tax=Lederbergia wuyishanensis TaxID=1347903 RepID=A0ABU0D5P5_9BACI|nr:FMN-binding glutamate synthase family protein [Lederbergia wuyishanensis]MCJ8008321.1 FMN-binding glutamate synthase family protein [Lederbergia wuyishanensis]MDQ0343733.1 glutamate synthase domain-containing protein 2 [Lederbergia wuyishanensis]
MNTILLLMILGLVMMMFLFFLFMLFGWRWMMKKMAAKIGKIVLSDSYQENIIEMIPGFRHIGFQNVLENNLRSASGDLLHRPLGSSKKWPNFDSITFLPAQTSPFAVSGEEEVDVKVTIGPNAKKPMSIDIPIIISGMGYGVALSEEVRLSLAEAASNVGTAINSGEGGVMPEEIEKAGKYILQFGKTEWGKDEDIIKQADMVEIKLGQGAMMAMGMKISPKNLTGKARKAMGLKENETAVIHEHFFENQTLKDIKELVDELRRVTGGVPIGAKMGAGGKIEEDIDHLVEVGVDFIAIDGAQAATLGAPPIISDDFGIPTLHAVVRAVNHLEKRKMKGKISLIVSGGLVVPGHFLKALALGADAVYIGSAILFAVAHDQVLKSIPFEPPTQVVWNEGKFKDEFKINDGVTAAEKFLTACTEEIKIALRAMGKRSLKELSKKDLVSYDEAIAKYVGVPFSFEPWSDKKKEK